MKYVGQILSNTVSGTLSRFQIQVKIYCTSNRKQTFHRSHRLDWSVYTCLTQLYGGRDMYNLLHKDQLHVSALFIGHLQVDN